MAISKKRAPVAQDSELNRIISKIYDDINELIRLCKSNVHYKVPGYRLKKSNRYSNQYSIINIETVKIAKGEVHDIFKNKTDRSPTRQIRL